MPGNAQENYEIQVYPYETVERGHTMVELHSNFTFQGSKSTTDGTLPTNHQWHETIEITHGFNDWFETGFYIFTSLQKGQGWISSAATSVPAFAFLPNGAGLSASASLTKLAGRAAAIRGHLDMGNTPHH